MLDIRIDRSDGLIFGQMLPDTSSFGFGFCKNRPSWANPAPARLEPEKALADYGSSFR